jgi:flagellar hook-length control protein FliK
MANVAPLASIAPPAPSPRAPAPPAPEPGEPSAFAKLLTASKPASDPAEKDAAATAEPVVDKESPAAEDTAAEPADKKGKAARKTKVGADADRPAVADMLAAMNRPVPVPVEPAPSASAKDGSALLPGGQAARAAADIAAGHRLADRSAADAASSEKFSDLAAAAKDRGDDTSAGLVQALDDLGDKQRLDHHLAEPPVLRDVPAIAPHALVHAGARADAGPVAAPVVVTVPTPATAPEFREALGAQVSVLTRDGVQHAELHLHPADMGPISVQIALDGTRAQVDFGADSFATRQIIESGLPELAAALRDAGFTLSGGGVSQHSRERSDGGEASGRPGGAASLDGTGEAASPVRRVNVQLARGAVDLYA